MKSSHDMNFKDLNDTVSAKIKTTTLLYTDFFVVVCISLMLSISSLLSTGAAPSGNQSLPIETQTSELQATQQTRNITLVLLF